MAVTTGKDGKLHYTNTNNKINYEYDSYGHWYDEGPGSESFKRELRESMKKNPVPPPNIEGFPWSTTKPKGAKKKVAQWPKWKREAAEQALNLKKRIPKSKEYITDEDLEIDV